MKINLATSVLLILANVSHAQNISSFQGEQNVQDIRGNELVVRSFDNRYQGIKGSPFLFEEWTTLVIIDDDNTYVLESKVEANDSKIIYKMANRLFEKKLVDVDSVYLILENFRIPVVYLNKYKTGLIIEGNTNYQIAIVKQLRKADYEGAYSQDRRYDEYITEVQLLSSEKPNGSYQKLKGSSYKELGISKKEIKAILSEGSLYRFTELVRRLTSD